jgi:hypothetical protein
VFEVRRITDRRRLAELLKYMNTQRCRVQMMRGYFGEPEGARCGLCDSCAGLDSEVFDPGDADNRHGLHAATDFHGRSRRRRRRGGRDGVQISAGDAPVAAPAPARAIEFETRIPDLLPPLVHAPIPTLAGADDVIDESVWQDAGGAGSHPAGEVVLEADEAAAWLSRPAGPQTGSDPEPRDFDAGWATARDANIRPYVGWVEPVPVSLPVLNMPRANQPGHQHRGGGDGQASRHEGDRGPGGGGRGARSGRPRRRRRRGGGGQEGRPEREVRSRGPRLPGMYNPGGD